MPVPTITNQTDVVVRITSSAICGSDLHMYHGFGGTPNVPYGFGHEAVGYVSSVGDAISSLEVGDYVIIPDNADDGHWGPSHPLSFGVGSASYGGLQVRSETARIIVFRSKRQPKLTQSSVLYQPNYLRISDVFTTSWHVLSYSGFQPSDTVAIFGAGPVGLLAAYSAKLRGASRVHVVDRIASRLEQAESFGAIPIDFSQQDPVEAILSREPAGVTRSLDCVGFESVNATGDPHNGIVLENMVAVTSVYGGMGIGGVYNGGGNNTEGAPNAGTLPAEIPIPMASLWRKGLSVERDIVLPLLRAPPLLDLIASGVAKPSFVVTAEIGIEDAPEYYRRYSDHLENKVVIRFP
ncbi:alcohol dehydrogenase GroES-like domain-containing protein [Colletotrichum paranaense]|uniref:Alcohol dehydrogenase GroES-like domain-containing protein n=1 Tax=Colletotrichum paranaense TaxID=1914294 RepID=A0ABQ9SY50_9PEZI|nr:alcohol dehydrogenase GroES-like domain-containing protein [Colletotrichum paranaense]KAK1544418.1 alcohol dehydrogenase GroES-like domain-containing protein [Colletotrichum paranaense]